MSMHENDLWDMDALNKGKELSSDKRNNKVRLDRLKRQVAEWERRIAMAQPRCRQVHHLIEKFGGILPFAVACNRHPNHIIYKWLGVTKSGTVYKARWGLVPSMGILIRLVQVSRSYGVVLTPDDLFPDLITDGVLKNPYSHPDLAAWAMNIQPDSAQQKLETEIAKLLEG